MRDLFYFIDLQDYQIYLQQIMSRQKTASLYTTVRHDTKRHCPEDLKCKGCCSCVQQYKSQNKILKEKIDKLIKDSQQNENTLARLSKKVADFQKRKEQFDKIDDFKLKIRNIIKKQLEQEKKAEDFILKERVESARQQSKQLKNVIQKLQNEKNERQQQINRIKHQLKAVTHKFAVLQSQVKRKDKQSQQSQVKIRNLKAKINSIQSILEQKSQVINRMQNALSQTEHNFMTEKIKARNNEFQSQRHQQQLKMKTYEINSLQKTTQQKTNSINNLAAEKQKLGKLVVELDSTVHSYSQLSNQLRERIYISQDYALQKQIQLKQLEADFYDTVYQRYS